MMDEVQKHNSFNTKSDTSHVTVMASKVNIYQILHCYFPFMAQITLKYASTSGHPPS
jgi:hypothetical protein